MWGPVQNIPLVQGIFDASHLSLCPGAEDAGPPGVRHLAEKTRRMDISKYFPGITRVIRGKDRRHIQRDAAGAGRADETAAESAQRLEDRRITALVKAAIDAHPDLAALAIGIDTQEGVVTLTRAVETRMQSDRAVALATQVPGVRYTNDQLVVTRRSTARGDGPSTLRIPGIGSGNGGASHE